MTAQTQRDDGRRTEGDVAAARPLKVGSLVWHLPSELHENQAEVVTALGHDHRFVHFDDTLPPGLDLILVQGPYGSLLPLARQLRALPRERRPLLVYWFQQSLDLHSPPWLSRLLVPLFSELQRDDPQGGWPAALARSGLLPGGLLRRGTRLRFLGDIFWLHRSGLLDVLGLSSQVYAAHLARAGIRSVVVPRGYHPSYGVPLDGERDIALVWMGKTRTRRRRRTILAIQRDLANLGHRMEIFDGVTRPFVYGAERSRLLNRTRFMLNLPTYPHDELSIRLVLAAANGAVTISDVANASPPFEPEAHYLSLPIDAIPGAIDHYVRHEAERRAIADRTYAFICSRLTLEASIRLLLETARAALSMVGLAAATWPLVG